MSPRMNLGASRRLAFRAAGVFVALGLAWWLVREVEPSTWEDALARVPVVWWPLAAVVWLGSYGVRARRLQQEWVHRGAVPWSRCLALVLQHNAAVLLIPFRLGEAGYVLGVSRQWGVGVAEAAWSLLRLRLQDLVVLGLLSLACLVPWGAWIAAGLALMGWGVRRGLMHQALAPQVPGRWKWQALLTGTGWAASALNWLLRLVVMAGCLMFLTPCSEALARAAALGAETGSLWPLQGPAGLGPFEAGAWAAAAWMGPVPSGLVDAALITHLFCVAMALGAAAFSLLFAPSPAKPLRHESQESSHVTSAPSGIG